MIKCGDYKKGTHTFISDWGRCLCGKTSREGLNNFMLGVERGECTLLDFSVNDEGDGVKETWTKSKNREK